MNMLYTLYMVVLFYFSSRTVGAFHLYNDVHSKIRLSATPPTPTHTHTFLLLLLFYFLLYL